MHLRRTKSRTLFHQTGLCLMFLDGGRVRELSMLYILKSLRQKSITDIEAQLPPGTILVEYHTIGTCLKSQSDLSVHQYEYIPLKPLTPHLDPNNQTFRPFCYSTLCSGIARPEVLWARWHS